MQLNEIQKAPSFNEITQLIETHCSDIAQFYRDNWIFMYRGIDSSAPVINLPAMSELQRKPLSTPADISSLVDGKLKSAGFTTLRSNSFFASGVYSPFYGSIYWVFPYNNFDWAWSSKIEDFYSDFILPKFKDTIMQLRKDPESITSNEFCKFFGYSQFTGPSKLLKIALRSSNEIMIHSNCLFIRNTEYGTELKEYLKLPLTK